MRGNGFNAITSAELTDEDLQNNKYKFEGDRHAKEAAWDLLTPLIAKKL